MREKNCVCPTNPEKASSRVAINSTMTGTLFFILTLIWALDPSKFSKIMIAQLILAIPLLYVSIFSYSKLGYWTIKHRWSEFAWITNTTGNIFVLNVVGLMAATVYRDIALLYFFMVILLIGVYYLQHIIYQKSQTKQRIIKFLYFCLLLYWGGISQIL
jgi:hypothetical protein